MTAVVRAMTCDDVEAAVAVQLASFTDLDRREGIPAYPITDAVRQRSAARHHHFLAHDPGGSFVAESDGQVVASALALRRDDLWGLSLLAVDPSMQSAGIGRRLLDAALG